jgi:hypothetical protein
MHAFNPLPTEQQLRSESSLPKFIRRIKQQLDLYELSDYANLHQADDELPHASPEDLSKRRKASALIKQSITDEVLDKFPDDFTGRQIIRSMQETHESFKPMDGPFGEKYTVAAKVSITESLTSRYAPNDEKPLYHLPNISRTLHPILSRHVAYVESSRARQISEVESQVSKLHDMQQSVSTSQELTSDTSTYNFTCELCSKSYQGSRQLQRHVLKHSEPNKFRCTVSGCLKTAHRQDAMRSHIKTHEKKEKQRYKNHLTFN